MVLNPTITTERDTADASSNTSASRKYVYQNERGEQEVRYFNTYAEQAAFQAQLAKQRQAQSQINKLGSQPGAGVRVIKGDAGQETKIVTSGSDVYVQQGSEISQYKAQSVITPQKVGGIQGITSYAQQMQSSQLPFQSRSQTVSAAGGILRPKEQPALKPTMELKPSASPVSYLDYSKMMRDESDKRTGLDYSGISKDYARTTEQKVLSSQEKLQALGNKILGKYYTDVPIKPSVTQGSFVPSTEKKLKSFGTASNLGLTSVPFIGEKLKSVEQKQYEELTNQYKTNKDYLAEVEMRKFTDAASFKPVIENIPLQSTSYQQFTPEQKLEYYTTLSLAKGAELEKRDIPILTTLSGLSKEQQTLQAIGMSEKYGAQVKYSPGISDIKLVKPEYDISQPITPTLTEYKASAQSNIRGGLLKAGVEVGGTALLAGATVALVKSPALLNAIGKVGTAFNVIQAGTGTYQLSKGDISGASSTFGSLIAMDIGAHLGASAVSKMVDLTPRLEVKKGKLDFKPYGETRFKTITQVEGTTASASTSDIPYTSIKSVQTTGIKNRFGETGTMKVFRSPEGEVRMVSQLPTKRITVIQSPTSPTAKLTVLENGKLTRTEIPKVDLKGTPYDLFQKPKFEVMKAKVIGIESGDATLSIGDDAFSLVKPTQKFTKLVEPKEILLKRSTSFETTTQLNERGKIFIAQKDVSLRGYENEMSLKGASTGRKELISVQTTPLENTGYKQVSVTKDIPYESTVLESNPKLTKGTQPFRYGNTAFEPEFASSNKIITRKLQADFEIPEQPITMSATSRDIGRSSPGMIESKFGEFTSSSGRIRAQPVERTGMFSSKRGAVGQTSSLRSEPEIKVKQAPSEGFQIGTRFSPTTESLQVYSPNVPSARVVSPKLRYVGAGLGYATSQARKYDLETKPMLLSRSSMFENAAKLRYTQIGDTMFKPTTDIKLIQDIFVDKMQKPDVITETTQTTKQSHITDIITDQIITPDDITPNYPIGAIRPDLPRIPKSPALPIKWSGASGGFGGFGTKKGVRETTFTNKVLDISVGMKSLSRKFNANINAISPKFKRYVTG